MKFEKINENKIKVILNISELCMNNVDFHSFMSNPLKSPELFDTILDAAEKQTGFNTKDYNLRIEVLSLSNIDFVITLTKLTNSNIDSTKVSKKTLQFNSSNRSTYNKKNDQPCICSMLIYCFDNFEDFCQFTNLFSCIKSCKLKNIKNSLYFYKNKYFLVFYINSSKNFNMYILDSIINEFAVTIHNSDVFNNYLCEHGNLIVSNNAINVINNYFI